MNRKMDQNIRWEQRFSNFTKALDKLSEAVVYIVKNVLSDMKSTENKDSTNVRDEIIVEGLIQRFEYTHELAWNVMKDYATYQGITTVGGSRDATREAFQLQLVSDGEVWMDMIGSRNQTSHTYNDEIADEIFNKIIHDYHPAFLEFRQTMEAKRSR
jgi:nucleotidyltransferase substrate binding protein (TIGR01987 family)